MRAPGGLCEHLGILGGSLWLSWGAFWPHFGSLGTLVGPILALLGRLGTSWDAFFAQVGPSWPKIPKKTSSFGFNFRRLAQVGSQKSRKIDVKNAAFFKRVFDIDFYRFFIDLGLQISTFFGSIFELKAKTSIL